MSANNSRLKSQSISDICDARPTLLVTSPSLMLTAARLSRVNVVATELISSTEWCVLEEKAPLTSVEAVIGLGGGSAMDVARLRGAQLAAEVTCVPTLLSTDAFLTSTTAVRRKGLVRYLPTGPAACVVIDEELLLGAPYRLRALGCCDVLSILTASDDWRSDPAACHSEAAIDAGLQICEDIFAAEDEVAAGSRAGLRAILAALEAEVQLCARYGDRVEEGSEHYFAYALEQRVPRMMHGTLVGLGILLCRLLQGQPVERLSSFMATTGIAQSWQTVSRRALVETLLSMPDFVREAGYPASVWDRVVLNEAEASALCDHMLMTVAR